MSLDVLARRLAIALSAAALCCGFVTAAEPEAADAAAERPAFDASKFVRVVRNADGKPTSLETATVRYVPAGTDGPQDLVVDLVAVTHVGEPEYFGGLNGQLADYDAVLYELVAPEGVKPQVGTDGGMIPGLLKGMLELEYQTERIDYSQPNFIHADLTPKQIGEKMRQRGQTGLSVAFDMFGEMMAQSAKRAARGDQGGLASFDLATLLLDPNGKHKLKQSFAVELEMAEGVEALGATAGQMLITDRNEAALDVLKKQIAAGKRRIAVFYGAGHMPDLERRLVEDFGLKRQGAQWREAWNLSGKAGKR